MLSTLTVSIFYMKKPLALPIFFYIMTDYEKIYDFQNLYKAHKKARLGKRGIREVIEFEMNLAENLTKLSDSLRDKTYKMSGYYSFFVHDPKERKIHALHYIDRVVQHCICDEVLSKELDRRLIYDNAACRIGKGTHFAIKRVKNFLRQYYNKFGAEGYFLKCDIHKFFDSIDHNILKDKLDHVFKDKDILEILYQIIDSFEVEPGKGLPMGNQTSQWFAIYYLDSFDRLIKEKLQIKYYSRYMDDCVLIHSDKQYLINCLNQITVHIQDDLHLKFNKKTQIFPLRNGVDYLGWHFYLSENGKVIRKLKRQTKNRYKNKLKYLKYAYSHDMIGLSEISQVISSYRAHLAHGNTYRMQQRILKDFILTKDTNE